MPKLDEQISTLQERLTQLKLRQQRVDARQRAAEATRERKQELRRRILVGALILDKARSGEMDAELLKRWLEETLTAPADRKLFQLAAREARPAATGEASGEGPVATPADRNP